jgi:hypothetical protein
MISTQILSRPQTGIAKFHGYGCRPRIVNGRIGSRQAASDTTLACWRPRNHDDATQASLLPTTIANQNMQLLHRTHNHRMLTHFHVHKRTKLVTGMTNFWPPRVNQTFQNTPCKEQNHSFGIPNKITTAQTPHNCSFQCTRAIPAAAKKSHKILNELSASDIGIRNSLRENQNL